MKKVVQLEAQTEDQKHTQTGAPMEATLII